MALCNQLSIMLVFKREQKTAGKTKCLDTYMDTKNCAEKPGLPEILNGRNWHP